MSLPPQGPSDSDETIIRDTWGEETVVVPEEPVVAEETVVEERAAPVRRTPLIWPWLLAFLLLVLGGLGAYYYFSQEDESTVPAVVGEPREAAEARVREAGFESSAEQRESAKPRGIVLDQSPDGGTELEEGETVMLTVSSGPPRETVPDVVGVTTGEAIASLKEAGFEAEVSEAFSDRRVGQVVRQDPAAGGNLKEGSTVALVVSKGREPVTVPDVVGVISSQAAATLREAGLEANLVEVPTDEVVAAGTVVAQNPGPGKTAKKGDTVRLNIARERSGTQPATTAPPPATTTSPGPAPPPPGPSAVPDAVGSPLADAARAFAGEGLKVSVQHVPSSEPAGQVVAQARPAGSEAPPGTTVQLNVSVGPEPGPQTSVPDVAGQQATAARSRLAGAGFEVLSIELDDNSAQAGVVLSQTPTGRAFVPRGSLVILYVSA